MRYALHVLDALGSMKKERGVKRIRKRGVTKGLRERAVERRNPLSSFFREKFDYSVLDGRKLIYDVVYEIFDHPSVIHPPIHPSTHPSNHPFLHPLTQISTPIYPTFYINVHNTRLPKLG